MRNGRWKMEGRIEVGGWEWWCTDRGGGDGFGSMSRWPGTLAARSHERTRRFMSNPRDAILEPLSTGMPSGLGGTTIRPDVGPTAARIDRLRGFRVRPPRETAIGGVVAAIRREASRHQRQAGSFVEAWESVVPESLRSATRVRGLRGGIARVGVRDAATRYELDAGLRGGWLAELRLACGQPVRSVRLDVDSAIPASAEHDR